jgi:hypothetical protein
MRSIFGDARAAKPQLLVDPARQLADAGKGDEHPQRPQLGPTVQQGRDRVALVVGREDHG